MKRVKGAADKPIELTILPHTGKIDGDDTGYRDWPVKENRDDIVVVRPDQIHQRLAYSIGPVKGLCPYYEGGLGAAKVAMVRKPVFERLRELDQMLKSIGLGVLLVDGWRSSATQVALWNYLFDQEAVRRGFKSREELYVEDIIELGDVADEIGSYNALEQNEALMLAVVRELNGPREEQIHILAHTRGEKREVIASLLITYEANRGWRHDVTLSQAASTAHGNGGATDVYMFDRTSGNPICLGVPFDYAGKASRMDFFEHEENFEAFLKEVEVDPLLRQYLSECGFSRPSVDECRMFARNRRILYHNAVALGATIYVAEPWHFNWPCGHGEWPESGNTCQALLKNAPVGVWNNASANSQVGWILKR